MKEYLLKPIMTRPTLDLTLPLDKPAVVRPVPPRQPLPRPVIDPTKPMLKLGLDTDLEFSMVVVQKDHASPQSPRKFTREQLVAAGRNKVLTPNAATPVGKPHARTQESNPKEKAFKMKR